MKRILMLCLLVTLTAACSAGETASTPEPVSPTASTSTEGTATPAGSTAPAIQPGEPWLVYHWYQAGKQTKDIFLVRPDGSDAHPITADVAGEHTFPSWSPDGTQIAFVTRDDETPNGSVWIINADGSKAVQASDGGHACPAGLFHPAWFPDGSKLAVVCYPNDNEAQVAVLDLETKKLSTVSTVTYPETLDNAPTVSPDGKLVAFDVLKWDPTGNFIEGSLIAVAPVAGGPAQRLTKFKEFMAHPDWSPNGRELVMNSYDLGNIQATKQPSNLYAIRSDGTKLRQITQSSVDGSMRIAQPRWSPDGKQIVVSIASATPDGEGFRVNNVRLGLVEAAGGEPTLVPVNGAAADVRPGT